MSFLKLDLPSKDERKPFNRYIFPVRYMNQRDDDAFLYYGFCKQALLISILAFAIALAFSVRQGDDPSAIFDYFIHAAPALALIPTLAVLLPVHVVTFVATITPQDFNPYWWNPRVRNEEPLKAARVALYAIIGFSIVVSYPPAIPLLLTQSYHVLAPGLLALALVCALWLWLFPLVTTGIFMSVIGLFYSIRPFVSGKRKCDDNSVGKRIGVRDIWNSRRK